MENRQIVDNKGKKIMSGNYNKVMDYMNDKYPFPEYVKSVLAGYGISFVIRQNDNIVAYVTYNIAEFQKHLSNLK